MDRRTFIRLCGAGLAGAFATAGSLPGRDLIRAAGREATPTAPMAGTGEGSRTGGDGTDGLRIAIAADTHLQTDYTPVRGSIVPQELYSVQIWSAFVEQIVREAPDALLLLGDLATSTRKTNHDAVITGLERLRDAGIRVLVTPGNHDLGESFPRETFLHRYAPYGFAGALARDGDTLSYLARLDDDTWVVMLDTCDLRGGDSASSGLVTAATLSWLDRWLRRAEALGVRVLVASHHPLLPGLPESYREQMGIEGGDDLARTLLAHHVGLHLCGHTHHHQISRLDGTDAQGRLAHLTELIMSMPMMYPHLYGRIELAGTEAGAGPDAADGDAWEAGPSGEAGGAGEAGPDGAAGTARYAERRIDVQAWADDAGEATGDLADFDTWSRRATLESSVESVRLSLADYEVPADAAELMARWWGDWLDASFDGPVDVACLEGLPGYAAWRRYGADTRYGPWVDLSLERAGTDFERISVDL